MRRYVTVRLSFFLLFFALIVTSVASEQMKSNGKELSIKRLVMSDKKEKEVSRGFTKKIPVLMYHHFSYDYQDSLTLHPDDFKAQMKLLKDHGYTTLTDQDVIAIFEGKMDMPEKPIMLTFDDGYESNYHYVFPVLQELNMKATIFIITDHIGEHVSKYSKMTWVQMKEMSDSGLVSFQSHTHSMHKQFQRNGVIAAPITIDEQIETKQQYEQRVLWDLLMSKRLLEKHLEKKITTLAYPFGQYSIWSEELAKRGGFKMTITTELGLIDPRYDNDFFLLKRVNIHGQASVESILKMIKKVERLNE